MKRLLLVIVVAFSFSSCSKMLSTDIIMDWYPVNFYIKVVDVTGKDLLDPANDNSWIIGTAFDFMGQEDIIDLECVENIYRTKYYLPHFNGITLQNDHLHGYVLKFGEFDGADSYDQEKLIINWPDGTSNTITYSRKFNLIHTDVRKEEFKLDGKKCPNPIVIVKE